MTVRRPRKMTIDSRVLHPGSFTVLMRVIETVPAFRLPRRHRIDCVTHGTHDDNRPALILVYFEGSLKLTATVLFISGKLYLSESALTISYLGTISWYSLWASPPARARGVFRQ